CAAAGRLGRHGVGRGRARAGTRGRTHPVSPPASDPLPAQGHAPVTGPRRPAPRRPPLLRDPRGPFLLASLPRPADNGAVPTTPAPRWAARHDARRVRPRPPGGIGPPRRPLRPRCRPGVRRLRVALDPEGP